MKCRILVVEDSATQAEALRSLMEEDGYDVSTARSGEAALQQLADDGAFNLVVSDIVMPGIDGFELCRRIKQGPHGLDLPVVLLTSLADPMDIVRGLECGADNYITKPYEAEHLLARIRHVVDNRRLRQGAGTRVGGTVRFLGKQIAITSDREQILDLFISSVEDVVRTNAALQRRERELADARIELEAYAREKAREARISTGRYRTLFQNAGDAIFVLDAQGKILEANGRATDLLGCEIEELPGQSLEDLVADESRDEVRAAFVRLGSEGQVNLGVRRLNRPAGDEVWCELTGSLTHLGGEDLVLLIMRDVTERQRTSQRLYETNQRLSTLIEASPLAIIAVNREGELQLWNQAAERIFGWNEEESLRRLPRPVGPDSLAAYRKMVERVLQGETVAAAEAEWLRKDGRTAEVSIYSAPMRAPGGEIIGCMSVISDITEQRRAEQALRDREEVERANRAKSEFLSRMSHELRTPLNAILGFAQLLEMDELNTDQTESVEQILRGGRHLLDLINEVLDLSRIEAGRLSVSMEPVLVRNVVDDAMSLIRPLATARGITLVSEGGDAVGDFVLGDLQRLKQVVLNFLSNAIKYNRSGGSVTTFVERVGEERLRLGVRDTGAGLTPDQLARLFVPFERLASDYGSVEGTGLGLVLAKGLTEAMGGTVGVESAPGEGSTFWIELGRADGSESDLMESHRGGSAALPDPEGVPERTILYIEDNTPNLRLVERVLARPGIRLLTAMQGSLGLELAQDHIPDLILLDLNLPDLPGEEVLRRMQADPALRRTPIVVISADALPSQVKRMIGAGARDYLTKPLDMKRFLEVVNECLDIEDE